MQLTSTPTRQLVCLHLLAHISADLCTGQHRAYFTLMLFHALVYVGKPKRSYNKSTFFFFIPTRAHTHARKHRQTHTHIHTPTHTRTHTKKLTHAHTHTPMHTRTHTQTHTHAHTHTHTHTHTHPCAAESVHSRAPHPSGCFCDATHWGGKVGFHPEHGVQVCGAAVLYVLCI